MSAKLCKYECGTTISWDATNKMFKEQDGTPHTKERCGSLKEKAAKTPAPNGAKVASNEANTDGLKDIAAAIRELKEVIRSRPL